MNEFSGDLISIIFFSQ